MKYSIGLLRSLASTVVALGRLALRPRPAGPGRPEAPRRVLRVDLSDRLPPARDPLGPPPGRGPGRSGLC